MDYSVEHIYVAITLVDGTVAVYVYAVRLVLYIVHRQLAPIHVADGYLRIVSHREIGCLIKDFIAAVNNRVADDNPADGV